MYKHWFENRQDIISKSVLVNSANALIRTRKFREHYDWVVVLLDKEKIKDPHILYEYTNHF
jgi:hypothetical protein